MKVRVTKEHIERGENGNCSSCPVALALRDLGLKSVRVMDEDDRISFYDPKRKRHLSLMVTAELYDWLCDFDQHNPVEPFNFELHD